MDTGGCGRWASVSLPRGHILPKLDQLPHIAWPTFQKGDVDTQGLLRPGLNRTHRVKLLPTFQQLKQVTRPARFKREMPWPRFSISHVSLLTSSSCVWPERPWSALPYALGYGAHVALMLPRHLMFPGHSPVCS